jgi:hypothetical protein
MKRTQRYGLFNPKPNAPVIKMTNSLVNAIKRSPAGKIPKAISNMILNPIEREMKFRQKTIKPYRDRYIQDRNTKEFMQEMKKRNK